MRKNRVKDLVTLAVYIFSFAANAFVISRTWQAWQSVGDDVHKFLMSSVWLTMCLSILFLADLEE